MNLAENWAKIQADANRLRQASKDLGMSPEDFHAACNHAMAESIVKIEDPLQKGFCALLIARAMQAVGGMSVDDFYSRRLEENVSEEELIRRLQAVLLRGQG